MKKSERKKKTILRQLNYLIDKWIKSFFKKSKIFCFPKVLLKEMEESWIFSQSKPTSLINLQNRMILFLFLFVCNIYIMYVELLTVEVNLISFLSKNFQIGKLFKLQIIIFYHVIKLHCKILVMLRKPDFKSSQTKWTLNEPSEEELRVWY